MCRKPGGRRSHADADGHRRTSVAPCSSAPTSPRPAASRRRSTASRRSAATRSRSSRRARACGGRRRTRRRRSSASGSAGDEARVKAVSCHALYLVNLASRDPRSARSRSTALRATMETARGDRRRRGRLPRRLAPRLRLRRGARASSRRPSASCSSSRPTTSGSAWRTPPAREARSVARSTSSPPRATRSTRHARLGICLDSCHWWASGVDVSDPGALDDAVADLDAGSGSTGFACLHVNDPPTPLGSNRDRHELVGHGVIGEGLATFLGHPRSSAPGDHRDVGGQGTRRPKDVRQLRRLYRKGRRRRVSSSSRP